MPARRWAGSSGAACRLALGRRRLGAAAPDLARIGQLELGERVAHRPHLLGVLLLEQRQQRRTASIAEPRLLEVAHVLGVGAEAEPLAAEVDQADDRLEQHVADRDPPQLLLEPGAQLLLARRRRRLPVLVVAGPALIRALPVGGRRSARPPPA